MRNGLNVRRAVLLLKKRPPGKPDGPSFVSVGKLQEIGDGGLVEIDDPIIRPVPGFDDGSGHV
jgi:hypothetical protein